MSTYNFLGLVNDVNRRLNEVELTPNNFSSAIGFYSSVKDSVNAALREINHQQFEWPFNHVLQEEELNKGDTRYFLPRDLKSLDMETFRIMRDDELGNDTVKLEVISYEEYLEKYVDQEYNNSETIQAIPRYVFRTPSQEYGVVPSPDKDYRIAYEYYRNPVSLNLHSDVPSLPEQFRYVIVEGAMYYTYQFRGDLETASLSLQKFNQGIEHMRTLYINRYEYVRSPMITRRRTSLKVR